jgi:5-methylcytosine-specific restriction endonuclease McrA
MLTPRKLALINGHETTVERSENNNHFIAQCACDCAKPEVIICASAFTEQLALERLRDLVLAEHGRIVMERAGWKCENCGVVAGLSAHHKIHRSQGRDDRCSNLQSSCTACHEREHRAGARLAVH